MDFLHIVIPLGDGVALEDIPKDVKEAAKKSVEMWEDWLEEDKRRRIEELNRTIEQLRAELRQPNLYTYGMFESITPGRKEEEK